MQETNFRTSSPLIAGEREQQIYTGFAQCGPRKPNGLSQNGYYVFIYMYKFMIIYVYSLKSQIETIKVPEEKQRKSVPSIRAEFISKCLSQG